jgi:hypothetical protein
VAISHTPLKWIFNKNPNSPLTGFIPNRSAATPAITAALRVQNSATGTTIVHFSCKPIGEQSADTKNPGEHQNV